ncbi:MAG: AAA family ATPase [Gemmatimonadetes bacterium]|nr:AAA family ATPase [Gemmatimonadota bacterium]
MTREQTCFLWGPRQTGKSTLIRSLFPRARRYDLLLADVYRRLIDRPELIREECLAAGLDGDSQDDPIVIDEVQRIPDLLNEVHWLAENRGLRFLLCGSSARKLKRGGGNLLGGRAVRYQLHPLVTAEILEFSLDKALNAGLLPRHYQSARPHRLIQAYVGDYLREEIAAEALTRNIPAFSRFLEVAALSNGELINYNTIAVECGVSAPTAKGYFQILEDTLIGNMVPAFRRRAKRRVVGAPRFYFFDIGVVAQLTGRGHVQAGSELFGRAFEHFIFMEVSAYASYSGTFFPVSFWRTTSGHEVDFIFEDVALEVKSTSRIQDRHLKGIRAFKEEFKLAQYIVVSRAVAPRRTSDGILILPWRDFLDRLWSGAIVPPT